MQLGYVPLWGAMVVKELGDLKDPTHGVGAVEAWNVKFYVVLGRGWLGYRLGVVLIRAFLQGREFGKNGIEFGVEGGLIVSEGGDSFFEAIETGGVGGHE